MDHEADTEGAGASRLAHNALVELERAQRSFNKKPPAVVITKILMALEARKALRNAARAARLGHGSPLVVLRASDLGEVADPLKGPRTATKGGRSEAAQ